MSETSPVSTSASGLRLIIGWVWLAALSQLFFLAYWPMFLHGNLVERGPTMVVALARMGVYAGLAWGLSQGKQTAWAATTLEFIRSLILFAVPVVFGDRALLASAYPPVWAQGFVTAAIPVVMLFDIALACGWRPAPHLESYLTAALRMWGSLTVVAAMWLRRHTAPFGVPNPPQWMPLLRGGLPLVLVLSAVEAGALLWSMTLYPR